MKSKWNTSIIYVNFAPYENTGNILTYLLSKFETVAVFTFTFHNLGKGNYGSTLGLYRHEKLQWTKAIFQITIPQHLVFIFLPIRSVILFLQLLYHISCLRIKYGVFDTYFTVNAFTAWCGILLKHLSLVRKTVFWVWDYYPPIDESKMVMFVRSLYWIFDKAATKSDRLIFLNKRLMNLRRTIGILSDRQRYPIVGIGTDITSRSPKKTAHVPLRLAYLGAIKKSQGLDFLFDHATEIKMLVPKLEVRVFGSGPDEDRFKRRADHCPIPFTFYGFVPDSKILANKLSHCDIGIALYMPDPGNVSYYGDPSKIKAYLSAGLPTITTDVFHFAGELEQKRAGEIIDYKNVREFTDALKMIKAQYNTYYVNALALAKQYDYRKLYKDLIDDGD